MKTLPVPKGSWKEFYDLVNVSLKSNIFVTSLKWKIYDHLEAPAAGGELAEKLGFHPRNLELFLNVLAGMEIIQKDQGRFMNSPHAGEFLVSASPSYIGGFLVYFSGWNCPGFEDYDAWVKNGPPKAPADLGDPGIWAESARVTAPSQYTGAAQRMAALIADLPEFGAMEKMLDLGGGAGFFAMAAAGAHPGMTAVVFDRPEVARVAQSFIAEYGMEDRVSVMGGDYMTDPVGSGYDLVLASATLNFVKPGLDEIIEKIYHCLGPGGVFISHADGLTHERTRPVSYLAELLTGELMGMDLGFPSGMIADAMAKAGFNPVRSFFVPSDSGEMEISIGRKQK